MTREEWGEAVKLIKALWPKTKMDQAAIGAGYVVMGDLPLLPVTQALSARCREGSAWPPAFSELYRDSLRLLRLTPDDMIAGVARHEFTTRLLSALAEIVQPSTYASWLATIEPLSLRDNRLVIATEHSATDWMGQRFGPLIGGLTTEIFGVSHPDIQFITKEAAA